MDFTPQIFSFWWGLGVDFNKIFLGLLVLALTSPQLFFNNSSTEIITGLIKFFKSLVISCNGELKYRPIAF